MNITGRQLEALKKLLPEKAHGLLEATKSLLISPTDHLIGEMKRALEALPDVMELVTIAASARSVVTLYLFHDKDDGPVYVEADAPTELEAMLEANALYWERERVWENQ